MAHAESTKLTDKYRPRTFEQVVGQDAAVRSLSGLLQKGTVRPLLIHGPYGTGKTTFARMIARYLNCTEKGKDGKPCMECSSCKGMEPSSDGSIRHRNVIEKNMSDTRGIDDIRGLKDLMRFSPTGGGLYRILILDEVHMLTPQAQQALLKPVEDPPKRCLIMLVTTDGQRLTPALVSRCVSIKLNAVDVKASTDLIMKIAKKEKFPLVEKEAKKLAKGSFGHPRNAVNLLENVMNYVGAGGSKADIEQLIPEAIDSVMQESPEVIAFKYVEGILSGNMASAYKYANMATREDNFFENALLAVNQLIKSMYDESLPEKYFLRYLKGLKTVVAEKKISTTKLASLYEFLLTMFDKAKTWLYVKDDLFTLSIAKGISIIYG